MRAGPIGAEGFIGKAVYHRVFSGDEFFKVTIIARQIFHQQHRSAAQGFIGKVIEIGGGNLAVDADGIDKVLLPVQVRIDIVFCVLTDVHRRFERGEEVLNRVTTIGILAPSVVGQHRIVEHVLEPFVEVVGLHKAIHDRLLTVQIPCKGGYFGIGGQPPGELKGQFVDGLVRRQGRHTRQGALYFAIGMFIKGGDNVFRRIGGIAAVHRAAAVGHVALDLGDQ